MNHGERQLQDQLGTRERADAFAARQTLHHLNDRMRRFIGRQEMMFLATADPSGRCDSTFRAGPPGFVRVLDEEHLSWPEYRGNGVMASLGNITDNGHVGLLFIDFQEVIGLHVNGTAEIVEDPDERPGTPPGLRARLWVVARVQEAYIHCAKHIPRMLKVPRQRSRHPESEQRLKKSDYFVPAPAGRSCALHPVPGEQA
ncbi:pyridoxamine 5'-phosphate oxidase family protein [Actinoplanes oblitus]|uniref:Pyridoxamine 5'-phosphate oxidase family protein n=1 Tax=Actinoplanes oblitus TaxID=3040509 RepID=A0ABY8WKH0_9ACTN|nr:pyridoxamine 5'-phosphate oxidase family protein [Actinoplanes oblitus]WIM97018.1 pyridoxamine 5'-phosphate oxidase family protein [Actinoplanes oblitus]